MRTSRRFSNGLAAGFGFAVVAAIVSVAPSARASEVFPPAIHSHLKLGVVDPPDCVLCHQDDNGGLQTVTRAFGIKMRTRGLVFGDVNSLYTALDALQAEQSDVDCDGVTDIDELKAGTDPNTGAGGVSECANAGSGLAEPKYGCGAHIAPNGAGSAGGVAALGLAAALTLSFIRRRRR